MSKKKGITWEAIRNVEHKSNNPVDESIKELQDTFDEFMDEDHLDYIDESILMDDQKKVMDDIITAMENGAKKIILSGSAGVGKTFLVNYIIKKYHRIAKSGSTAYITAPTNRAVAVLIDKETEHPYYMNFSTIHKALYMKRVINDKTGDIYFKPDYRPKYEAPFRNGFIIVVDEASMLNSEILFYLEDEEYEHIPMIFLGDNKQLNPVGEDFSPVFRRPEAAGKKVSIIQEGKALTHIIPQYHVFELTKIIRQAENNPVIKLSMNLPKIGSLQPEMNGDMGYEYTSDLEHIVKLVANDEEARYLAWTNEAVDKFNVLARRELYWNPQKLQEGETIIFSQPYEGNMGTYHNNTELKIKKLRVEEREFTALPQTILKGSPDPVGLSAKLTYYVINDDVKVIHESSEYDFLNTLNKIKQLTKRGLKWSKWFQFSEKFARVSYRYATTVHKAQGGTFDTIVVNMKDLNRNFKSFERKRLWYTAITRTSRKVIFYNEKNYYQ